MGGIVKAVTKAVSSVAGAIAKNSCKQKAVGKAYCQVD